MTLWNWTERMTMSMARYDDLERSRTPFVGNALLLGDSAVHEGLKDKDIDSDIHTSSVRERLDFDKFAALHIPNFEYEKGLVRKANILKVNDLFTLVGQYCPLPIVINFHSVYFSNSSFVDIYTSHHIRICIIATMSFITPEPEPPPPHEEEDIFYDALSYQTPASTPITSPSNASSASDPIVHPERTTWKRRAEEGAEAAGFRHKRIKPNDPEEENSNFQQERTIQKCKAEEAVVEPSLKRTKPYEPEEDLKPLSRKQRRLAQLKANIADIQRKAKEKKEKELAKPKGYQNTRTQRPKFKIPSRPQSLHRLPAEILEMILEMCDFEWNGRSPALIRALRQDPKLHAEAMIIFLKQGHMFSLNRRNGWSFHEMPVELILTIKKIKIEIQEALSFSPVLSLETREPFANGDLIAGSIDTTPSLEN